MLLSRCCCRMAFLLPAVFAFFGSVGPGNAQKPAPPPAGAPTLNMTAPLGIQRGTSLEVTLTGTDLASPTALWTSFPAKVVIPTDHNNGKDAAKLRVRLDVAGDAPLGYHGLRLATARGASNLRLFCVDELPQVLEVDSNRSKTTPQAVPVPCVVVGRADAEVSDYFKISVKAGMRLSFDVLGRRLGSAFDPQLTLLDARTGRELPGGHSNDAPGCQTDPRLSYTFKEAGEYLLEVRDVMYRGGADYWYRLRVGDFPLATTPVPMAAKRGSQVSLQFAGPAVENVAPVEVLVPADTTADVVWITPRGPGGLPGWPVALAISDFDEILEQEPNNEPAKANRVPVPGAVTARFLEKGDLDHFVFAGQKGQKLVVEAHTQELHSPTEVYMILKDAKGAQVAVSNPMAAPRLEFTPPADADYTLAVEHLLYWGGPAESYRITIAPPEPGFDLALTADRFTVAQDGHVMIPVVLSARRDYNGPIDVTVGGPAGVTGQATIDAGKAPSVPPKPGQPAAPAVQLLLQAQPDVPMGAHGLTIRGTATIDGKTVTRYVDLRPLVSQGLANLPYPPRHLFRQVGLAVTERPPFTLTAKLDQPEVLKGGTATVTVMAVRGPGFAEEITLAAANLPANVKPALKNIPKEQSEVKVQLVTDAKAAAGQFLVTFTGTAKFQDKSFTVTTLPVNLVVALPFELKVEGAPLKLKPGDKAKLTVTAVRKGGYQGPINLEVRNLPPNVTAGKADIAAGQSTADIEITAAAGAAAADKKDVNVLGTAADKQQNASPNFAVVVEKKGTP